MSLTPTYLLEGLEHGTTKEGKTWTESRLYASADLELVMAQLPLIYTPHPTVFNAVLQTKNVVRAEAKEACIATLSYGPRTSSSGDKPVQNQFGEIWDWMQLAQMKHITQSPAEVWLWQNFYPNNPTQGITNEEPAEDRLIRKNGEDKVEGTEIYQGTGALRVSKEYESKEDISTEFRQMLYLAQAKQNAALWFDWGPGEMLFLGSNIRLSTDTATVDFNFLFGNVDELKTKILGNDLTTDTLDEVIVPYIYPFNYVWTEPGEKEIRISGDTKPVTETQGGPWKIKVTAPYPEMDFEDFGLGGPE